MQSSATVARPAYYKYLSWSPTVIGITGRAAELLEKHLGVTTVEQMLRMSSSQLLAIPQFGTESLANVMQSLANVGFPVKGYIAQQTRIDQAEIDEYDDPFGLNNKWTARLFIPSAERTPVTSHPVMRKPVRTSIPAQTELPKIKIKAKRMAKSKTAAAKEAAPETDQVTISLPKSVLDTLVMEAVSTRMQSVKDEMAEAVSAALGATDVLKPVMTELRALKEVINTLLALVGAEEVQDDGEHVEDAAAYAEESVEEDASVIVDEELEETEELEEYETAEEELLEEEEEQLSFEDEDDAPFDTEELVITEETEEEEIEYLEEEEEVEVDADGNLIEYEEVEVEIGDDEIEYEEVEVEEEEEVDYDPIEVARAGDSVDLSQYSGDAKKIAAILALYDAPRLKVAAGDAGISKILMAAVKTAPALRKLILDKITGVK